MIMEDFTPGRSLYLDKDGKVVEADDPTRLTKLTSETSSIPMARAMELGLMDEPEAKAIEAPPENKAITMPKETKKKKGKK